MQKTNFEFKARTQDNVLLEKKLLRLHPRFVGEDHQVDTYFEVSNGRLKLREGNIENALIHYKRKDFRGAKQSDIRIFPCDNTNRNALKSLLKEAIGIRVCVDKKRRIYFIDNVKFHFDHVKGLGSFMEVEAIDDTGSLTVTQLQEQCNYYQQYLGISDMQMESQSYSDMLLQLLAKG